MPKVTPKVEVNLEEVFKNPEFAKYADQFLGLIERHYRMVEGFNPDKELRLEVATKILQERLK